MLNVYPNRRIGSIPTIPFGPPSTLGADVVGELDERLAEEQRDDRQVVADQPRGPADEQAQPGGGRHHQRDGQPGGQVDATAAELAGGQQGEPVGAAAEERDVAEVEQPGPAHHDVQADREQGDDQRVDPDLKLELAEPEEGQHGRGRGGDRELGPPADPLAGPLQRAEPGRQVLTPLSLPGDPTRRTRPAGRRGCESGSRAHTFWSWAWPSSPLGRTSITAMSSRNTSRLL